MKVYVLTCEYAYEGEQLLGVYATKEDALPHMAKGRYEDDRNLYEVTVGAAPESYKTVGWGGKLR